MKIWLIATAMVLCACQSSPAKHFHALNGPTPEHNGEISETIGIGPVELPEFLHRPQVTVQHADGHISFSSTQVWAEPLDAGMARVLSLHLAANKPGRAFVFFPWRKDQTPDYNLRVQVNALSFDQGQLTLAASWQQLDAQQLARTNRQFSASTPSRDKAKDIARSLDRLLAQLAEDMAPQLAEGQ